MNTSLVSIIVPCYNQAKYLTDSINSVIAQNYKKWECIIINDGSTDNTEKVASELCKKDHRISLISQKNTGVCIARNNAIMASNGKYILCLDADDLISLNFLKETVELLENDENIKIATTSVNYFGHKRGNFIPKSYNLGALLADNQLVVTSLFRRIDFNRVEGFNSSMSEGFEDWDFWIRIIKDGGVISHTDKAIFYYRILRNSRNSSLDVKKENRLRYTLWENHKELYSKYFVNPRHTFEYKRIYHSKEYRIGEFLLNPIRKILTLR